MKQRLNAEGFTLLEALIALLILGVGIMALSTLQLTAVKGNGQASRITSQTAYAVDAMERALALPYDDILLTDVDDDGVSQDADMDGSDDDGGNFGLDDAECCQNGNDPAGNNVSSCTARADGCMVQRKYYVYWNVATDLPILNTKTIKVIVRKRDHDSPKRVEVSYVRYDAI